MSSTTTSVRLHESVVNAAKHRSRSLGFPSLNLYLTSLIVYDLTVRKPHTLTRSFLLDSSKNQLENYYRYLEKMEVDGHAGLKGSFFEELIKSAAQELGADGEKLIETLRDQIRGLNDEVDSNND